MHEEAFSLECDISLLHNEKQEIKPALNNWEPAQNPCKVMGRKINSAATLTANPENAHRYPLPVQITMCKAKRSKKRHLQDISNRPRSQNSKSRFKSKTPEPVKASAVRTPNEFKKNSEVKHAKKLVVPNSIQKSAVKKQKISIEIPLSIKENSVAKKSINSIVLQTLKKQQVKKKQAERTKNEEKERQSLIKKQLAELNKNTRLENFNRFKQEKFHPKCPWGTDERRITRVNDVKLLKEADEFRKKKREERERSKSAGKSRIGLDIVKVKKDHSRIQEEETPQKRPSREKDRSIVQFIKKQRKQRQRSKELQLEKQREDENKRLLQLLELEKITRKSSKQHKSMKISRKKPLKKSEESLEESHINYSEDEEVMDILQGVRSITPESFEINPQIHSFDYKQNGRECMVFGVFPESISLKSKANITQMVSDIVEKRLKHEESLPIASATMPLADVQISSSVVNTEEEYRESESSDISKRKNEIRKKLSELRNRVDKAKARKSEDYDDKQAAAIKIQAWVRGFLTREALRKYFEELQNQSIPESTELDWVYESKRQQTENSSRSLKSSHGFSSDNEYVQFEKPVKKQQEIERILRTQSEWREIQKEKLVLLKNKDLEDMRAIAQKVGSEDVLMKHFEEIIERRYANINQLFDENIEAVKSAVKQAIEEENQESLLHTLEKQENFASEIFQNLGKNDEFNELLKLKNHFDYSNIWEYSENEAQSVRISELDINACSNRTINGESSGSHEMILKNFRIIHSSLPLTHPAISKEPVQTIFDDDVIDILENIIEQETYIEIIAEVWDTLLTSTAFINSVAEKILQRLLETESTELKEFDLFVLKEKNQAVKPPANVPALELKSAKNEGIVMNERHIVLYIKKLFDYLSQVNYDVEVALNFSGSLDPLEMLGKMQEAEIGVVIEKTLNIRVLPLSLYIDLEKEVIEESHLQEAQHIHNKMIFDVVNECLIHKAKKPEPMPWSFDSRCISHNSIKLPLIIGEVLEEIKELNKVQAGKLPKIEFISNSEDTEEELIQQLREEQLSSMLSIEILSQEPGWVNYEFEETQVKLDLSDMTLEELVEETIAILGT